MVIAKKKGYLFGIISDFPVFLPKPRCSLKKKGLHFDFIPDFPILFPKLRCSLKKKGRHLEKSGQKLGNREIDFR